VNLSESLRKSVSGVLPSDEIDTGVAIIEYSIKDFEQKKHPKDYMGLTRDEIRRRLHLEDIHINRKDLQEVLDTLYQNSFIVCRKKLHYSAASRFKQQYKR